LSLDKLPRQWAWASRCTPDAPSAVRRYQALGRSDNEGWNHCCALFRAQLDTTAVGDIRLALNQSQPLGNAWFHAKIEQMTGQRREARPRGWACVESRRDQAMLSGQTRLHFAE